jgi:hypothetical protein
MPGLDRTGPVGAGPRSGRGRGICGKYAGRSTDAVREDFRGIGRGGAPRGCGRGRCFGGRGTGQGWRGFFGRFDRSSTEEPERLRAQLKAAEQDIAVLRTRLEELAAQQ